MRQRFDPESTEETAVPTLTDEEQAILDLMAKFVDTEVRPVVHDLEQARRYGRAA
jgi:hypothetical protein